MKLIIESTTRLTEINGTPARLWRGTTEQGYAVDVLVCRIGADEQAQPELEAAVAAGEIASEAPTAEEAIRDALLLRQSRHEETCPGGGKPCWKDRAGMIAWLAHCLGLGVKPGGMIDVLAELEEYDRCCRAAECGHNDATR